MNAPTDTLRIGELARRSGVNLETLRYYERRGLLPKPPRTRSGYRSYPTVAVQRVRFIKRAQALGFSLSEIYDLLALGTERGKTGAELRRHARAEESKVKQKIRSLQAMKTVLREFLRPGRLPAERSLMGLVDDKRFIA